MSQKVLAGQGATRENVFQTPAARIVGGAVVGAIGGFLGTALLLRSPEAGILGAIAGAIVSMLGALTLMERAEV